MDTIAYAGLTDRGRVREQNEDNWFGDPDQGLFVVSDGMGGHAAGEVASKIVVETLPRLLRQRMKGSKDLSNPGASRGIVSAISELSNQVRDESKNRPGLAGMGATVVIALIRDAHALIAHMGDSRAYLFKDGRLEQFTKDHSIIQLLIDSGEITPEEAVTHPARGKITRYVGMQGEPIPEARFLELEPGDRLLLCSDGLTGMVSDSEITNVLRAATAPEITCQSLVEAANAVGGEDNITAVVADWRSRHAAE